VPVAFHGGTGMSKGETMKTRVLLPALLLTLGGTASAGPPFTMPAYYDGKLFNINFTEMPAGGETSVEQHNGSINTIYQCDQCVAAGFPFISVLDAIQGDGFNPLWEEHQITFVDPNAIKQFKSDTEVLNARDSGVITIADTEEVYRCSVLGPGPKNPTHK
jgi:hypothetical protein